MRRLHTTTLATFVIIACAAWVAGGAAYAFQKANPQDFSGNWQLNEPASTNPGGPAPGAARSANAGRSSGRGGDAGGSGNITGSTAKPVDISFGKEEQARTLQELALLQKVPQKLEVKASATEFVLVFEGGASQSLSFTHSVGKKNKLGVPVFDKIGVEGKVSWAAGLFKRELTTPDSLTVNEEYSLSADGKQLTVVLTAKSRMMRIPEASNPPIKRVYDRVQ